MGNAFGGSEIDFSIVDNNKKKNMEEMLIYKIEIVIYNLLKVKSITHVRNKDRKHRLIKSIHDAGEETGRKCEVRSAKCESRRLVWWNKKLFFWILTEP